MALQQPQSVLMSLAPKTIKGDADVNGLYCDLEPWYHLSLGYR